MSYRFPYYFCMNKKLFNCYVFSVRKLFRKAFEKDFKFIKTNFFRHKSSLAEGSSFFVVRESFQFR